MAEHAPDPDQPPKEGGDERKSDRGRPARRQGDGPSKKGSDDDSGDGDKSGDDDKDDKEDKDDKDKDDDGKAKKPSPFKKTWVRVVLVIVAVCLIVAGSIWFYRWWTHGRFVESTNNAYLQADEVIVSAKVAGTVEEVLVGDNQQVHRGDLLVRIDDSANRARIDQALAQVNQARAGIAQYEAQIGEQEAAIAQALAAVDGADDQRRFNQGEVERYAPLATSGAESREKLAQTIANRDQALATLRQNQASAVQARRRIATLKAQIRMASAQADQAEAQARQVAVDVDSSSIRASVDGRVGDRQVRVGQTAVVGTRLLTIVPVQSLYLVANFKETQIGLMRVGQPATIDVDALDGHQLSGSVDSFAPATGASFAVIPANNATGNFTKIVQRVPVRIRIEAGEEARKVLIPGLSVEVSVDTLGSKDDKARVKDEARDSKDQRKDEHERAIQNDRREPASGAGQ